MAESIPIDAGETADGVKIWAALLEPFPRFGVRRVEHAAYRVVLRAETGSTNRVEHGLGEHGGPQRLHDQRFTLERPAAMRSCPVAPALPRYNGHSGASGTSIIAPLPVSTAISLGLTTVKARPD